MIVLSPLIFGEKITSSRLIAFFDAFLGVLLINGQIVTTGLNVQVLLFAASATLEYAVVVPANNKRNT